MPKTAATVTRKMHYEVMRVENIALTLRQASLPTALHRNVCISAVAVVCLQLLLSLLVVGMPVRFPFFCARVGSTVRGTLSLVTPENVGFPKWGTPIKTPKYYDP